MWNKIVLAFGAAFGTALAVALGVDIYEHQKVAKKIGLATEDIKKATINDISVAMLEKAVQNAADEQTATFMRAIKSDVVGKAEIKLSEEARKAVSEASAEIKQKVGEKVSEEVSKIDISELKKSARDKAEAKILEKFDGNLEDLLEKFNDNLSNVQKIYGGIADAISKNQERDKGLKFTIG